jgi:hypothetical protein
MSHTPEPWWHGKLPAWLHATPELHEISIYHGEISESPDWIGYVDRTSKSVEEFKANVRLVTAAPKLLRALEQTLNALCNETFGKCETPWIAETKKLANSVIAEVKGDSQ